MTLIKGRSFLYALSASLLMQAFVVMPGLSVSAEPADTVPGEDAPTEIAEESAPVHYEITDPDWPVPPQITAETAVLLEANTGMILYGKDMHRRMYPASTTKMLTCLLAVENLDLSDTITFSESAIHSVPADGSKIGMDVGETITVEQALYGILVGSANEVSNAVAEKVSGSTEAFAALMNQRAQELGCTDSNFVNAHGYHDDNHYTSAHDLALIAKAFFDNETLSVIGNTPVYHFPATATQPDDFYLANKHRLITGETPVAGVLGGKTGYTSLAGETLVTGMENKDLRLICVVMKDAPGEQFTDTRALFSYGTASFAREKISSFETDYTLAEDDWFRMGDDLLGTSAMPYSLSETDSVLVPVTAQASELVSIPGEGGLIRYYFNDTEVGNTWLVRNDQAILALTPEQIEQASAQPEESLEQQSGPQRTRFSEALERYRRHIYSVSSTGTTYIDIRYVLLTILALTAVLSLLISLISYVSSFNIFGGNRRKRRRRGNRTVYNDDYFEQDPVYFHPGRFDDHTYDDSNY
ncbi:MAG: D-alanyl-D-alanine carboxypeptidase [Lachnospiraceae bacterium]|nr:D-alanyl-D-alanine carboxypeptidase [Lachnospiraceae bacterium]